MTKNTRGIYLPDGTLHQFADRASTKTLGEHIATRNRSPDFTALGMLLPNPDPILKKMGRDAAVYRDLRSDAHVGGSLRRRKAAVKAMEWRLVDSVSGQTGSSAGQKASTRAMLLAQDTLAALDLYALLGELLDAPLFGWVPVELMWHNVGGALLPTSAMAKPHEWFHFDPEGLLRFKSRQSPMHGEELAPRKFLVPRQDASYANPYGFADLSMVFWPTTFKRGGLKFWVTFAEKFGTPMIVGKLPRSAGAPETDALLDQLEAMVQDAVAVVPDDASVDIAQSSGKSDAAGAYKELLMFCRSEVSIALLGQNQSTEANSTHASATAGLEVTKDLRDGDARLVEGAINQLLRWVTDLNESEQAPAPRFELFEQAEISEMHAKRDEALTRSGVVFSQAYWERTYNLEPGDVASAGPGQVAARASLPRPPAGESRGRGTPASDADELPEYAEGQTQRDAMDELVAAELADWQPIMDPMTQPLQRFLQDAAAQGLSAAEVLERLPVVLAQMDASALGASLTRTAFAAAAGAVAGLDDAGQGEGRTP